MIDKKKCLLTPEEVERNVKKIDGSMAQEGMPLTKEIKDNIRKCLMNQSTVDKECRKVINRYKKICE